jgi:hypothetical protein
MFEGETPMPIFGAFELRYGRARTGACSSLRSVPPSEEVEGQINSLQHELDEIRERARRAFQVA